MKLSRLKSIIDNYMNRREKRLEDAFRTKRAPQPSEISKDQHLFRSRRAQIQAREKWKVYGQNKGKE